MVLAQPELHLRADHSGGEHAPDLGRLQRLRASGAGAEERGALPGEGDLLSGGDVGRAAYDGGGLAVAQFDGGKRQAVGVGM